MVNNLIYTFNLLYRECLEYWSTNAGALLLLFTFYTNALQNIYFKELKLVYNIIFHFGFLEFQM